MGEQFRYRRDGDFAADAVLLPSSDKPSDKQRGREVATAPTAMNTNEQLMSRIGSDSSKDGIETAVRKRADKVGYSAERGWLEWPAWAYEPVALSGLLDIGRLPALQWDPQRQVMRSDFIVGAALDNSSSRDESVFPLAWIDLHEYGLEPAQLGLDPKRYHRARSMRRARGGRTRFWSRRREAKGGARKMTVPFGLRRRASGVKGAQAQRDVRKKRTRYWARHRVKGEGKAGTVIPLGLDVFFTDGEDETSRVLDEDRLSRLMAERDGARRSVEDVLDHVGRSLIGLRRVMFAAIVEVANPEIELLPTCGDEATVLDARVGAWLRDYAEEVSYLWADALSGTDPHLVVEDLAFVMSGAPDWLVRSAKEGYVHFAELARRAITEEVAYLDERRMALEFLARTVLLGQQVVWDEVAVSIEQSQAPRDILRFRQGIIAAILLVKRHDGTLIYDDDWTGDKDGEGQRTRAALFRQVARCEGRKTGTQPEPDTIRVQFKRRLNNRYPEDVVGFAELAKEWVKQGRWVDLS